MLQRSPGELTHECRQSCGSISSYLGSGIGCRYCSADGTQLPPNRDVIKAIESWRGQGCLGEHGAATSRTGLQRLGKDNPRHPSRDEEVAQNAKTCSGLVSSTRYKRYFAGGQLAVFQGASDAPIYELYGSSEQRGKTAN